VAIVCSDSSALVKLVVGEADSDLAAELWDGSDAAVASRLAYPKVRAALAAAGRNHDLDEDGLHAAGAAWEEYWAAIRPVEFIAAVEQHAGRLAGRPPRPARRRRGPSRQRAGHRDPGLVLAVWDRRLHTGATAAGLRVAPAQLS
jgi:hypothetical protein